MAHNLTNEKFADMHMVHGAAHGNAREALRFYQQRFPNQYLHSLFRGVSCVLEFEAVTSSNYCTKFCYVKFPTNNNKFFFKFPINI